MRRELHSMWRPGILLAAVFLSSCYSTRPYGYEGRDSNATIVVYRGSDVNLALLSTLVGIDGNYIVKLQQKRYVEIQLAPGKHELRVGANQFQRYDARALEVVDLQRIYFEVKPNLGNLAAAADPTGIAGVAELLFMRPFLLEERTDEEFRAVVEALERSEPEAAR